MDVKPSRIVEPPSVQEVMENGYEASMAVVMYLSGNRKTGHLETFKITENRLHSPTTVSKDDLDQLSRIVARAGKIEPLGGIIPEELVSMKGSWMCFMHGTSMHRVYLTGGKKEKERWIWLPTMLFKYMGPRHSLKAFWCCGSTRDVRENRSVLMAAPMPNINTAGTVCLGTSMQGVRYTSDIRLMMDVIIKRFFSSSFNEWHQDHTKNVMQRCAEIAMDPMLQPGYDPDVLTIVEKAFWENVVNSKEQWAKKAKWTRLSDI